MTAGLSESLAKCVCMNLKAKRRSKTGGRIRREDDYFLMTAWLNIHESTNPLNFRRVLNEGYIYSNENRKQSNCNESPNQRTPGFPGFLLLSKRGVNSFSRAFLANTTNTGQIERGDSGTREVRLYQTLMMAKKARHLKITRTFSQKQNNRKLRTGQE